MSLSVISEEEEHRTGLRKKAEEEIGERGKAMRKGGGKKGGKRQRKTKRQRKRDREKGRDRDTQQETQEQTKEPERSCWLVLCQIDTH